MKKSLVTLLLITIAAGLFAGAPEVASKAGNKPVPVRIVSLAPSVTETLFALGLGSRVAGVTRQCLYPPEAQSKTIIGGYYDPNYEQIVRLKPDLVIMLPEHRPQKKMVEDLGITVLVVDHNTIDGIISSCTRIGDLCGVKEKAVDLVSDLSQRMARVKAATRGDSVREKVMVCLGRGMASGSLTDIFIAGKGTLYDDMVALCNADNVYTGSTIRFPQIELEGLYKLNPSVIIDLVPNLEAMKLTRSMVEAEWKKAKYCSAVRNGRVYLIEDDYATVPGPRFILTLEKMARMIYPGAPWK